MCSFWHFRFVSLAKTVESMWMYKVDFVRLFFRGAGLPNEKLNWNKKLFGVHHCLFMWLCVQFEIIESLCAFHLANGCRNFIATFRKIHEFRTRETREFLNAKTWPNSATARRRRRRRAGMVNRWLKKWKLAKKGGKNKQKLQIKLKFY